MRDIIKSLDKNKTFIIAFLIITEFIFMFLTYKSFYDRVETIDKTSVVKKEKYSMYIQDGNSYVEYTATNTFPNGYVLNLTQSRCVDGNDQVVSNALTKTGDKVTVTSNQTLFCTLYFDQDRHFASYLRSLCSSDNTIVAYSGKVTDDVSQIGTGVDATKVCAFTSNTNNNVVFANHCWQIRRTTETGGVKIQYNGEPTLGTDGSGNTTYDCGTSRPYHTGGIKTTTSLGGTYLYGDSYTTSVSGGNTTFTLTNTQSVEVTSSNASTVIPTLVGKYTCKNGTGTCTNTGLYKVDDFSSYSSAYVYQSTYNDAASVSAFNNGTTISHVGYMYNTTYPVSYNYLHSSASSISYVTLNASYLSSYSNYLYGDSYTMYGTSHMLTNSAIGNTIADYPTSWVGKYFCRSSSVNRCDNLFYVSGIDTSGTAPVLYYSSIDSNKQHDDPTYTYVFGDDIIDNGNGTFTMTNPQELYLKDWYSYYSSIANKYMCRGTYVFESNGTYTCNDNGTQNVAALKYITAATATDYSYDIIYKYGYGIEASGGSYQLTSKSNDEQTLQYIIHWPNSNTTNCFANGTTKLSSCGYKTLSNSHYTCLNLNGICDTYYFIYRNGSSLMYKTPITGGKYVSSNLNDQNNIFYDMLTKSDVNTTNSIIKDKIDFWYLNNLLNTSFEPLIDSGAVFCDDRRIVDFGGWDPDGVNMELNNSFIAFAETNYTSNLNCERAIDAFSVNNSIAQLTYPIALASVPEMSIVGKNARRYSPHNYWLLSPGYFSSGVASLRVDYSGNMDSSSSEYEYSVRPVISLSGNAEVSSGTGSTIDPYVITGSEMTP